MNLLSRLVNENLFAIFSTTAKSDYQEYVIKSIS